MVLIFGTFQGIKTLESKEFWRSTLDATDLRMGRPAISFMYTGLFGGVCVCCPLLLYVCSSLLELCQKAPGVVASQQRDLWKNRAWRKGGGGGRWWGGRDLKNSRWVSSRRRRLFFEGGEKGKGIIDYEWNETGELKSYKGGWWRWNQCIIAYAPVKG